MNHMDNPKVAMTTIEQTYKISQRYIWQVFSFFKFVRLNSLIGSS